MPLRRAPCFCTTENERRLEVDNWALENLALAAQPGKSALYLLPTWGTREFSLQSPHVGDPQPSCLLDGWLDSLMVPTKRRSHTLLWGSEQPERRQLQTFAQGLSVNQIPAGRPQNKAHPHLPTQLSSPLALLPYGAALGAALSSLSLSLCGEEPQKS